MGGSRASRIGERLRKQQENREQRRSANLVVRTHKMTPEEHILTKLLQAKRLDREPEETLR